MKRIIPFLALYIVMLTSCAKKEVLPDQSQLDVSDPVKTAFDEWITSNYTSPYNIKVKYKWDEGDMSDFGRYNIPPEPLKVRLLLEVLQNTWIESYSEIAGPDFVKKIAPRELIFRGGDDLTTNGGNGAWGQASGGKTITLFSVNEITAQRLKNPNVYNGYSGLIHHEYAHILNQIRNFDEAAYKQITPAGYTANWQNFEDWESNLEGFVSSYARMNVGEDFAEMVKFMLTMTRPEWDNYINSIEDFDGSTTATKAKEDLRKKEGLVVSYFTKVYGIDIYKLQEKTAQKRAAYLSKP